MPTNYGGRGWRAVSLLVLTSAALFSVGALGKTVGTHLSTPPCMIRGLVLAPDGQTPVVGFPIRVWDADNERFVYQTKTDGMGAFGLPRMSEGSRYVIVGHTKLALQVLQERAGGGTETFDLVVVLPEGIYYPGGPLPDPASDPSYVSP